MSQPYVPICAAPLAVDDTPEGGPMREQVELKKRRAVSVACNSCRKKRVRCDGQRPTCSNCWDQKSHCVYRSNAGLSPETQKIVVEITQTLGALAAPNVMRVIAALASETNAATILSTLRSEALSSSSNINTTSYDSDDELLEFATQNPIAYPSLQAHGTSQNQHSEVALSPASRVDALNNPLLAVESLQSFPSHETKPETIRAPRSQPETAPDMCDPRLREFDIGMWTPVPITNYMAARCISLYLQTDHPLLGHFDPDLFISHLVSGKVEYCSSLLVNALLYWACQMYSCVDPQADEFTMPLCTEAERLWRIERDHGRDSVANIAAAELICLGYLGQGRDHAILHYVSEASQMGIRMGLFGIEDHEAARDEPEIAEIAEDSERWRAHAAWGVFNWITLLSLFYRQPGLLCPKHPPRLPTPKYSFIKEHGPENLQRPSLHYMGNTFPHLCHFWYIVHEVSLRYYGDRQQAWGSESTIAFAEYKYRELLAWSSRLPSTLSQDQNHPHHVQILHLWFHAVILDIFRPCMQENRQQGRHLRTFSSKAVTLSAVCEASTAQLKHLITAYREHSSSRYTFLWQTAMVYVANSIVNEKRDANWYADFLMCLYGYESLGRSWRVAASVAKGLLSLALRKGALSGRTAKLILHDLQGDDRNRAAEEIRATFMGDLNLAMLDPDSATVEQLASQFDAHVFLKDFTTVLDDPEGAATAP